MKQLKFAILALGCIAALSLTSCLGDDNDNNQGLTPAEVGQCLTATKGSYQGKIYYQATNPENINDAIDTLDVRWTVTADTTLIVQEFPAAVAAANIKGNNDELKEALLEADPQPLNAYLGFYENDPISFLLYPLSVKYTVFYGERTHSATVVFWVNNYSYGIYNQTSRLFEMQFVLAALYIDDDTDHNYLASDLGIGTANVRCVLSNQENI